MSKKPVLIAPEQATQSASGKRYLDDFKRDAVRLVTEERYTFKAAAITYLPTAAGWVYLAVVMDLFSRKVVGWALNTSLATELVAQALWQAIEVARPNGSQLLHHSDRGCQYTSDAYQQTLRILGIDRSMSRTGCCYDNAVAERFFWSLKHEWTKHQTFNDLEHARLSVFKYIETFYNPIRIHQTLDYLSPNQYEAVHAPAQAA